MKQLPAPTPSAHAIRGLAYAATCDPRTVLRFLRGEPVRPMVAVRLRRALEQTDGACLTKPVPRKDPRNV